MKISFPFRASHREAKFAPKLAPNLNKPEPEATSVARNAKTRNTARCVFLQFSFARLRALGRALRALIIAKTKQSLALPGNKPPGELALSVVVVVGWPRRDSGFIIVVVVVVAAGGAGRRDCDYLRQ